MLWAALATRSESSVNSYLQYLFWYIKQRRRLQGSQPSSCRMAGFRLLLVLLHSAYRL